MCRRFNRETKLGNFELLGSDQVSLTKSPLPFQFTAAIVNLLNYIYNLLNFPATFPSNNSFEYFTLFILGVLINVSETICLLSLTTFIDFLLFILNFN